MFRPIPDKNHWTLGPDRHYSVSIAHHPLLSALRFHGLTNCFFRKPFILIIICVAPWCFPQRLPTFKYSASQTNQVFHIHTVANSLSSRKKSSALESATCGLFHENTGWGLMQGPTASCRGTGGWEKLEKGCLSGLADQTETITLRLRPQPSFESAG